MKDLAIMATVKKFAIQTGMKLQKRSPEILLVTGVIGVAGATVMACVATTKISGILDNAKEQVEQVNFARENPDKLTEEYTEEDAKQDLTIIYAKTGVQIAKLYLPSFLLGAISITGIVASHNIMNKRNAALAAAYATVDKGLKEYRSRVKEKYGEEIDKELRHGLKAEKIETVETDEKGKEKKVKSDINVVDARQRGEYTFFFDESSIRWEKDGDYNRMFLLAQQQYANDRLRANGFLFLNDVLEDLGLEKTKAGQIVGWVYDPSNPNIDNFVDFGIFETYQRDELDAIKDKYTGIRQNETYSRVVILDFNVDGNIWDIM